MCRHDPFSTSHSFTVESKEALERERDYGRSAKGGRGRDYGWPIYHKASKAGNVGSYSLQGYDPLEFKASFSQDHKAYTRMKSTHVASMREELGLLDPGPVGLHCRV